MPISSEVCTPEDARERETDEGPVTSDHEQVTARGQSWTLPEELSSLAPWMLSLRMARAHDEPAEQAQAAHPPTVPAVLRVAQWIQSVRVETLTDKLVSHRSRPAFVEPLFARALEDGWHKELANLDLISTIATFLRAAHTDGEDKVPTAELRAAKETLMSLQMTTTVEGPERRRFSPTVIASAAWQCLVDADDTSLEQ